ncbi:MAG: translocation/assembly module TamB domain-containing protein, partial [Flavitalea sp.]
MKLPLGKDPVYSGKIETDHFRLGEFIGDPKIGAVSLTGTVKGSGFNEKSRNSIVDGTIRFAEYNNYRYENIVVKGQLDKKKFEGTASIRDKHADLDLNGIIDFNTTTPTFNLIADIAFINLKNLNLIQDDLSFSGKLNFNFTSSTIDNFLGTARITDAVLTKDGKRLPFDSLIVSSDFVDGVRKFRASSNELEATVTGDFSFRGLPDAFRFLLNKYYPSYVKAPSRYPDNQNIEFNIITYNVDEYLQLLDSSLSGFNNSRLQGNMNLAKSELNFTAEVPQFKLGLYNFDEIRVVGKGTPDSLVITGETRNIRINDSLSIPQAVFHINAHNDISQVSIVTGANQTVEKANLNARVLTYSDGVEIDFEPSSFTINSKTWNIDETGKLSFRRNAPISGQVILSEGDQRIALRTVPSSKGTWNDIQVELTRLNLGDFAPFFMPSNRLEGLITGNVLVEDPTGNLKISSDAIQTQFLRLDNDSLGELRTTLAYDKLTKELVVKGNTL